MLSSHTILLRYTPPTCTLEITAKSSPLSRWTGRPTVKQLRFKLHFNDPRVPEEQRLTIQGDRDQLEQLSDAVTNYVQEFLHQSPTRFPLTIGTGTSETSVSSKTSNQANEQSASNFSSSTPSLRPMGLLAHELSLGSLSTETSGQTIKLSALQLFDLANALEEYRTEMTALPELNRSPSGKVVSIWVGSAAALVLVVGLTTAGVRMLNRSEPETASAPSVASGSQVESDSTPESSKTTEVVPPTPPTSDNKPVSSLKLPESLASNNKLPPPPPIQEPPSSSTRVSVPNANNIPSSPNLPPLPSAGNANSKIQASSPNSSPTSTVIPKLPNLPPLQPKSAEDANAQASSKNAPSQAANQSETPTPGAVAARSSSPNIPQLGEVKSYFQQRWQPPENLSGTLQYRLIIASDGTIRRIIPIGKASEVYLDRTGMPLMGEPFVSPTEGSPTIRVVLNSDGTVQTFSE